MVRKHTDNLDLQVRRKRLRITQTKMAELLGGFADTNISRFENGHMPLPRGLTREDYIKALDDYAAASHD